MAVKKKAVIRKNATVKKKTTVKKAAVKKKAASRKKAVAKKKTTAKNKTAQLLDENALSMLDTGVDEMEVEHEDGPLLVHDPLAMITGDESANGVMADEESSLLGNDPFAMIAEGGEEAEQHFGFRAESSTEDSSVIGMLESMGEAVAEPEPSLLCEVNEMGETAQSADRPVIDLGSDLTIADVEAKKIELTHILADALPVKLNAEELEQIDGAGLQLLAALFKNAAKNNLEITWVKVSSTLMDAVKLVGLVELLNMQDAEIKDAGEGTAWGMF
jgi:anti-anti-sigma regulatory factor